MHEHLLRDLLGDITALAHVPRKPKDPALISLVKSIKGGQVALHALPEQIRVIVWLVCHDLLWPSACHLIRSFPCNHFLLLALWISTRESPTTEPGHHGGSAAAVLS